MYEFMKTLTNSAAAVALKRHERLSPHYPTCAVADVNGSLHV